MTQHTPTINAAGIARPFSSHAEYRTFEVGISVHDIVASFEISEVFYPYLQVCIDGELVDGDWEDSFPSSGQEISFKVVPQGGDGKNPLATILTIALVVAVSMWNPAAGAAIAKAGLVGAAKAGIMVVGMMAIQAIAPPPVPDSLNQGDTKENKFISQSGNKLVPYGIIPRVLGRHRVYPVHGATPYSEVEGDDMYMTQIFIWSDGGYPDVPTSIRIGSSFVYDENGSHAFEGMAIKHHFQMTSSDSFEIYKNDVFVQALSLTIDEDELWEGTTHITEPDTTSFSTMVSFPEGLYHIDGDGDVKSVSVALEMRYRVYGSGDPWEYWVHDSEIDAQVYPQEDWVAPTKVQTYWNASGGIDIYHEPDVEYYHAEIIFSIDMNTGDVVAESSHFNTDSTDSGYLVSPVDSWFSKYGPTIEKQLVPLFSCSVTNIEKTPASAPDLTNVNKVYDPETGETIWPSAVVVVGAGYTTYYTDDPESDVPTWYTPTKTDAYISELVDLRNSQLDVEPKTSDWEEGDSQIQGLSGITSISTGDFGLLSAPTIVSSTDSGFTLSSITVDSGPRILQTLYFYEQKVYPFVREFGPTKLEPETYEFQIRRTNAQAAETSRTKDKVVLSSIKSINENSPPISEFGRDGLNLTEIRIKANEQLNGAIDEINGVLETKAPLPDGSIGVSSNPASLIVEVLLGTGNARPVGQSRIDYPAFVSFWEFCNENNLTYNKVLSESKSVEQICREIASAGLADFTMNTEGQWSVVIDNVKSTTLQTFSPRRSWGFSATRTFVDKPHGIRLPFISEEDDWATSERILYWNERLNSAEYAVGDVITGTKSSSKYRFECIVAGASGLSEPNWNISEEGVSETVDGGATFRFLTSATELEQLDLVGSTDWNSLQVRGRYYLAVMEHRSEVISFSVDVDSLICHHGGRIRYNSDIIDVGLGAGVIRGATEVDGGVTNVVLDNELSTELGTSYSLIVRKNSDGTEKTLILDNVITETSNTFDIQANTVLATDILNSYFIFGVSGHESMDLLIKEVTPNSDLTAELACITYTPNIPDYSLDRDSLSQWDNQVTPVSRPSLNADDVTITSSATLEQNSTSFQSPEIIVTISAPQNQAGSDLSVQLMYRIKEVDGIYGSWIDVPENTFTELLSASSSWIAVFKDDNTLFQGKTVEASVVLFDKNTKQSSDRVNVTHLVDYTVSGVGSDPIDLGWDAGEPKNVVVQSFFDNNYPRINLSWNAPAEPVTKFIILAHYSQEEDDGPDADNLLPILSTGTVTDAGIGLDIGQITLSETYAADELNGKWLVLDGTVVSTGQDINNLGMEIESNDELSVCTIAKASVTDLSDAVGMVYSVRDPKYVQDIIDSNEFSWNGSFNDNHFAWTAVMGLHTYLEPYLGVYRISGTVEADQYPLNLYNNDFWGSKDAAYTDINANLPVPDATVSFSQIGLVKTFSIRFEIPSTLAVDQIVPEGVGVQWKVFESKGNALDITGQISSTKLLINVQEEIETFASRDQVEVDFYNNFPQISASLTTIRLTRTPSANAILLHIDFDVGDVTDWGGKMWCWISDSAGNRLSSVEKVKNTYGRVVNLVDQFDYNTGVEGDYVCYAEVNWHDNRNKWWEFNTFQERLGWLWNRTTDEAEVVELKGIKTDDSTYMEVVRASEGTSEIVLDFSNTELYYMPAHSGPGILSQLTSRLEYPWALDSDNNVRFIELSDVPLQANPGDIVHISVCSYMTEGASSTIRSYLTVPEYLST